MPSDASGACRRRSRLRRDEGHALTLGRGCDVREGARTRRPVVRSRAASRRPGMPLAKRREVPRRCRRAVAGTPKMGMRAPWSRRPAATRLPPMSDSMSMIGHATRVRPRPDVPAWAHWCPGGATQPWTVGVEEEAMLLDARTGAPANRIEDVLAGLPLELRSRASAE